jgi:hypothetical protein
MEQTNKRLQQEITGRISHHLQTLLCKRLWIMDKSRKVFTKTRTDTSDNLAPNGTILFYNHTFNENVVAGYLLPNVASLKIGHDSTSTGPSATALPGRIIHDVSKVNNCCWRH